MIQLINQSDYKVSSWSGGTTRELFIAPQKSNLSKRDFKIRISSAIINSTHSTFSNFNGFKRLILPLEGNITLFRKNEHIKLSHSVPFYFDGSEIIESENSSGAIDFNVIYKYGEKVNIEITDFKQINKNYQYFIFALENIKLNNINIKKFDSAYINNETFQIKGKTILINL